MVEILDKAINNPDQVQAVSAGKKEKLIHCKQTSYFISTLICSMCLQIYSYYCMVP